MSLNVDSEEAIIGGGRVAAGGGLGGRNRALFKRARFSFADSRALERRVFDFLQLLRWLLNAFVYEKVRPQQHS